MLLRPCLGGLLLACTLARVLPLPSNAFEEIPTFSSDCSSGESSSRDRLSPDATFPDAMPATPVPAAIHLTSASGSDDGSCRDGTTAVGVEGAEGTFCVAVSDAGVCSATNKSGACPERQPRLPSGSECVSLGTGVYGCSIVDGVDGEAVNASRHSGHCNATTPAGPVAVSVLGRGTFCTTVPVCAGAQPGNCPGIQPNLSVAAKCKLIRTGVHGCVT